MGEHLMNVKNTISMSVKCVLVKYKGRKKGTKEGRKERTNRHGIGRKAQRRFCVVRCLSSLSDFPPRVGWDSIPRSDWWISLCHCKSKEVAASYERIWFLKLLCHRIGNPMIAQRLELFIFRLPHSKPNACCAE